MSGHRSALLACTAIRSGVCLIPLWTGSFVVPIEYPWPRVLFRRWPVKHINGRTVFFSEETAPA